MVSDRRGLGERLKRQRERRGVTLQQIAQSTKVPASLFAALEAGDCSRWPAGLYARAYMRAYANAIGLNPDETVEEFVAAFGSTIKADGIDGPQPNARTASALRLSLAEALRQLTPRQRAVVVLRYYEDLPEAQVAEILGCSVGTVRSQTHRTLARLRVICPELSKTLETA